MTITLNNDFYRNFDSESRSKEVKSIVQRTSHTELVGLNDVCINLRCPHVLVSEKFLHGANVVAVFEQMSRKRVTKGVRAGFFQNSGLIDRGFEGSLDHTGKQVMPPLNVGTRVERTLDGRKNVLPNPFPIGVFCIFFRAQTANKPRRNRVANLRCEAA